MSEEQLSWTNCRGAIVKEQLSWTHENVNRTVHGPKDVPALDHLHAANRPKAGMWSDSGSEDETQDFQDASSADDESGEESGDDSGTDKASQRKVDNGVIFEGDGNFDDANVDEVCTGTVKNDELCNDLGTALEDDEGVGEKGTERERREKRGNERREGRKGRKNDCSAERRPSASGASGMTTRQMKQMSQTMAQWIATPTKITKGAERVPDVWE